MLRFDDVEMPAHYTDSSIECIDAMQAAMGEEAVYDFCKCNAFKYLWRADAKHPSPVEDLQKARWYIDKALDMHRAICDGVSYGISDKEFEDDED